MNYYRFHENNGLALLHEAERLGYLMQVPEMDDDFSTSATETWTKVLGIVAHTNAYFYTKDFVPKGWAMLVHVNQPYEVVGNYETHEWIDDWDTEYCAMWEGYLSNTQIGHICPFPQCRDREVWGFSDNAYTRHEEVIHHLYRP